MNKYDKFYKKTEEKIKKKEKMKSLLLEQRLIIKMLSSKEKIPKYVDLIQYCLVYLSEMDNDFIEWFKKNFIEKYDNTFFYLTYMCDLCYFVCSDKIESEEKDIENLNIVIKSFVKSGLIKNIEIDNRKNDETDKVKTYFKITLPNNEKIIFSNMVNSQKDFKKANGNCHGYSELLIKEDCFKESSIVTGYYKDFFKNEHYHTFILYKGIAYDICNNIIMKYEDYIELFNFQIILKENSESVFSKIKYLSETDKGFNESPKNNIIKITMNYLMNNRETNYEK